MDIKDLKKEVNDLRETKVNFINVSNAEWYSLFKDEIRNSIAIEGVFANRTDLLDVLERNKRTNNEKTASILGYFDAASSMYEYAHNQYKEKEFMLRLADIKQIHTLLMRYEKDMGFYIGELGEFRRGPAEVAQAKFKPISAQCINDAMKLLVSWINNNIKKDKIDPVTLAAVSHVWFENIHPFSDGNGRVGRIFLSYILIGMGLVNVAIKGVASSDRERYYHSLEICDECFEDLHRDIEKNKTLNIDDVNGHLDAADFGAFRKLLIRCLEDSIKRLAVISKDKLRGDAVLSLRELAEAYDYSQDYLRNLINRGELTAHKEGKLWYVRVRDMQKYIERISK